jgi:hypothetical protein
MPARQIDSQAPQKDGDGCQSESEHQQDDEHGLESAGEKINVYANQDPL